MFARRSFGKLGIFTNWNVIAIFVLIMNINAITMCAGLSETAVEPNHKKEDCEIRQTCSQCTDSSECGWSFDKQSCGNSFTSFPIHQLVVTSDSECPRFTVTSHNESGRPNKLWTVKVSNLRIDLSRFLLHSTVTCRVDGVTYPASLQFSGSIVCDLRTRRDDEERQKSAGNVLDVSHVSVVVDGVPLRFDDPIDHYVAEHRVPCESRECAVGFWTDKSTAYYCKWCVERDYCPGGRPLNECDLRPTNDSGPPVAIDAFSVIVIKSPAIAIESFEPRTALSVGDETMTVTVKNHRFLAANRQVTVTAGGRSCRNLTTIGGDTLICVVSKRDATDQGEGPVEVTYESPDQQITFVLRSQQTVRFVNPIVSSFSPKCGPAAGGTAVSLTGKFLNVTNNVRVTVAGVPCAVHTVRDTLIGCTTGGVHEIASDVVDRSTRISFGEPRRLFKQLYTVTFEYTDPPYTIPGQPFAGIASGGTRLRVRGRFNCVQKPQITYHLDDVDQAPMTAECQLVSDTKIVCPTPRLSGGNPPNSNMTSNYTVTPSEVDAPNRTVAHPLPQNVPFHINVDFGGQTVKLTDGTLYEPRPDPTFTGFGVNGTAITVNGLFSYAGYDQDELQIRVTGVNHTCRGLVVDARRIVCQIPEPLPADAVQYLEIAVGKHFLTTVNASSDEHVNSRQFQIASMLGGVSIASVFVALVLGLMFCYKIVIANSRRQTEKRYIEELRNITAGV